MRSLSWATFKLGLEEDTSNFELNTQLWPMEYPHQLTPFPGFSGSPFQFHAAETTHTC